MTKPKQRSVRTTPEPETEAILDESFDELEQADAEWCRWRWPMRNDAESGAER